MKPKLSIITICYNEQNIRETCESIVNQTWKHFDLKMISWEKFEQEKAYKKCIGTNKADLKIYEDLQDHAYLSPVWDYGLTYAIYTQNGLCINPAKNLVKNIGINAENSVHVCSEKIQNETEPMDFPLKHPVFFCVDVQEKLPELIFSTRVNQFIKNIFSIKREFIYKVITIFGIKLKFKSKKYINRLNKAREKIIRMQV